MRRKRATGLITAEEIACFVYCPEQWRLQHGLGLPSANAKAMKAGIRHHARKAGAERLAGTLMMLGRVLVVVALLVVVLWVLSR